ncbi:MFS transporter [Ruficoccus amylovorans]|uniref:MFS transporter n=1 Tax=Ruficoccus amylovorans TaxID=1804625 RepID=A0A842H8V4_9BACT|nr:MFS transporter [Ruficoccus amylovorans]MBC2592822.1 MFS transporter [Ruficoccus amylovorans]
MLAPYNKSTPQQSTTTRTWSVGTLVYTSGGLAILFFWLLLGDFSWSMRDRSVGPLSQWYLSSLEVPNLVFGLIVSSFPAAIGLILGPIISVKSDRHRGRWGRRIPFLLITTPMAALGMIGIGVTPLIASWVHGHFPDQEEWVVAVACFSVFWAFFEFATIAGQAVFGGLINDVVPKELLGRFYGMFRAISLIDGMIFNYWIMGKAPSHFTLILIVVGVFYGTSFMLVCFRVKEGEYPPPPSREKSTCGIIGNFWSEVRLYCRQCFTNPYYLSIFVMMTLATISFYPVNIFALPYARSLDISMDLYGKALALTYGISLSITFFIGWLVDVFHPLRVAMVSLFGYMLATLWGSLLADTQQSFLVAWVAHGVLSGCFFTSSASLGQRLYPHEKFAQFASAAGIFTSMSVVGIGPLVGTIIDLSGNVYRYTFTAGLILSASALLVAFYVYRRFTELGGTGSYSAPE